MSEYIGRGVSPDGEDNAEDKDNDVKNVLPHGGFGFAFLYVHNGFVYEKEKSEGEQTQHEKVIACGGRQVKPHECHKHSGDTAAGTLFACEGVEGAGDTQTRQPDEYIVPHKQAEDWQGLLYEGLEPLLLFGAERMLFHNLSFRLPEKVCEWLSVSHCPLLIISNMNVDFNVHYNPFRILCRSWVFSLKKIYRIDYGR